MGLGIFAGVHVSGCLTLTLLIGWGAAGCSQKWQERQDCEHIEEGRALRHKTPALLHEKFKILNSKNKSAVGFYFYLHFFTECLLMVVFEYKSKCSHGRITQNTEWWNDAPKCSLDRELNALRCS